MKHLILGESNDKIYRAKNILFFFSNKFYLLSSWFYDYQSDHDLLLEILETNIKKHKIKEFSYTYEISKSNRLEKDFRNSENDFIAATKKSVYETNYIYYDNAGKRYAIQTLKPYTTGVINATDLYSELDECKDFLLKHNLNHLIQCADDLFNANKVYNIKEKKYLNKIEEVIKFINNQI